MKYKRYKLIINDQIEIIKQKKFVTKGRRKQDKTTPNEIKDI